MSIKDALPPVEIGAYQTGNVPLLLNEIRHALAELLATGTETTIDLKSLPMAPGEEQRLEEALGPGEVTATLDALGRSELRETGFAGAWLVTHLNTEGKVMGKFIEITRIPSLLKAQDEDIREALELLAQQLDEPEAKDSQHLSVNHLSGDYAS